MRYKPNLDIYNVHEASLKGAQSALLFYISFTFWIPQFWLFSVPICTTHYFLINHLVQYYVPHFANLHLQSLLFSPLQNLICNSCNSFLTLSYLLTLKFPPNVTYQPPIINSVLIEDIFSAHEPRVQQQQKLLYSRYVLNIERVPHINYVSTPYSTVTTVHAFTTQYDSRRKDGSRIERKIV